ncbi:MAG: V-type ATPase subunit [Candidatus Saganbacteria bacterium]|nr:V-type ATPase subunit [Candidatus Saganbacteria bacterium]
MSEFYYGSARIRVLENRLLTPAQLERMVSAKDFAQAFNVLSETAYAANLHRLKHAFEFEELVEIERLELKDLLLKLAPEHPFIFALLRHYDYQNLKILLRAHLAKVKPEFELTRAGVTETTKLQAYIESGAKDLADQAMLDGADQAVLDYEHSKDPAMLDISLDRHYYAYLNATAQALSSPLIKQLISGWIDLLNIKTTLRSKQLGRDKKALAGSLLTGGLIGADTLTEIVDKGINDISARLNYTTYFPTLSAGFAQLAETGSFSLLEKEMDDLLLQRFRKAKYLNSGIEPLTGFYLAKESELKTLRFILISKSNFVQPDRIKSRLRFSYA